MNPVLVLTRCERASEAIAAIESLPGLDDVQPLLALVMPGLDDPELARYCETRNVFLGTDPELTLVDLQSWLAAQPVACEYVAFWPRGGRMHRAAGLSFAVRRLEERDLDAVSGLVRSRSQWASQCYVVGPSTPAGLPLVPVELANLEWQAVGNYSATAVGVPGDFVVARVASLSPSMPLAILGVPWGLVLWLASKPKWQRIELNTGLQVHTAVAPQSVGVDTRSAQQQLYRLLAGSGIDDLVAVLRFHLAADHDRSRAFARPLPTSDYGGETSGDYLLHEFYQAEANRLLVGRLWQLTEDQNFVSGPGAAKPKAAEPKKIRQPQSKARGKGKAGGLSLKPVEANPNLSTTVSNALRKLKRRTSKPGDVR